MEKYSPSPEIRVDIGRTIYNNVVNSPLLPFVAEVYNQKVRNIKRVNL